MSLKRIALESFRLGEDFAPRSEDGKTADLLRALPVAIYATDASGCITFYNDAAVEFWGRTPEIGESEWGGLWRLYWPDGQPMSHDECPMAVALKENRAIEGVEAMAERLDGKRVAFLAFPTPLRDSSGAAIGAVNTLVDITERNRGEEARQRLSAIIESSDDAIISKNLEGLIETWNGGAERLFGYAADEVIGKPIRLIIPPDRQQEEDEILAHIRRGERIDHYETIRVRKDGTLVEISVSLSPVKDAGGRIVSASKIARDIGERKRTEEQQALLVKELSHRVKNLFAVASGVVAMSARSAQTPQEMAAAVRERLAALSRAHELARPGPTEEGGRLDQDATLAAVVKAILAPYEESPSPDGRERFETMGPVLRLNENAVTSLALILHEFATNAAKYGALTSPTGGIHINWSIDQGVFLLVWREYGGPPVAGPPEKRGFGSVLAERTIAGGFGGEIRHEWNCEGLTIRLSAPVDRLRTG
jgi:PAS domain S-box-containing protein